MRFAGCQKGHTRLVCVTKYLMSFHNVSSETIPKSYQKNFVILGQDLYLTLSRCSSFLIFFCNREPMRFAFPYIQEVDL